MPYAIRRTILIALIALSGGAAAHKVDDPSKYVTTSIAITGLVEHKLTLSVDDLKKFPQQQMSEVPIVNHEGKANTTFRNAKGVLLRDILEKASVKAADHGDTKKMAIIATASDGYVAVYSWSEVFNSVIGDGVLVIFENEGKALDDSDGRIAMVSAKDTKTGFRHVRWLKGLEVRKIVD